MKNYHLIFLTFFIFFINTHGQAKTVLGYYISNDNTKLLVNFIVYTLGYGGPVGYSDYIPYIDSNGLKRLLKPDSAKLVSFTCNGELVELVSKEHLFLKIVYDKGYLKHYVSSWMNRKMSDVLQKGNEPLYFVDLAGFFQQKKLVEYLSDCPIVSEMVRKRKYDFYTNFIRLYNDSCSKR